MNIIVKKGFDINLKGHAHRTCHQLPRSAYYSIRPQSLDLIIPKLLVKEGTKVNVGDPIFCSKQNPSLLFTSPVSGQISDIKRGAKRVILSIDIKADATDQFKTFDVDENSSEAIQNLLLESGCWSFIKQRPYNIIADPNRTPKSIFISACPTAPLAPDLEYLMAEDMIAFQKGIDVLHKLANVPIYLGTQKDKPSIFLNTQQVNLYQVSGPHPSGNVSVHINKIDPINSNETIWTIAPQDVAIIGKLFQTGQLNCLRKIAVVGATDKPQYYETPMWTLAQDLLQHIPQDTRLISGDVLTGTKIDADQSIGFYDHMLTLVSEAAEEKILPYLPLIKNNKIPTPSSLSFYKLFFKNKPYEPTTVMHGEERAFTVTGEMEKVFPFDIYPMYLLKAILAQDIEKMEHLGIYEVIPEDFGLIDYVSSSKIDTQQIIRQGIELMIKEVG